MTCEISHLQIKKFKSHSYIVFVFITNFIQYLDNSDFTTTHSTLLNT